MGSCFSKSAAKTFCALVTPATAGDSLRVRFARRSFVRGFIARTVADLPSEREENQRSNFHKQPATVPMLFRLDSRFLEGKVGFDELRVRKRAVQPVALEGEPEAQAIVC